MLINQIGTESEIEITTLSDRRPSPDPKNRETLTTLLRVAMSPVTRSELMATTASKDATVSTLDAAPLQDESTHTDVA